MILRLSLAFFGLIFFGALARAELRCPPLLAGPESPLGDWVAAYEALMTSAVKQGLVSDGELRAMLSAGDPFVLSAGSSEKLLYVESLLQIRTRAKNLAVDLEGLRAGAIAGLERLSKKTSAVEARKRRVAQRLDVPRGTPYARLTGAGDAVFAQFLPGGHRILATFVEFETLFWEEGAERRVTRYGNPFLRHWTVGRAGGDALQAWMSDADAAELRTLPGLLVQRGTSSLIALGRFDLAGAYSEQVSPRPVLGMSEVAAVYSPLDGGRVITAWRGWLIVDRQGVEAKHDLLGSGLASIALLTVSPDGKWLAMGLVEGTCAIWDLRENKVLSSWSAHSSRLSQLSFSDDGEFLLTASADEKEVRVWDLLKEVP